MSSVDKIKDLAGKVDKEALAGAIGLMCLSWAALPVVYWLIVRNTRLKGGHPSPALPVGEGARVGVRSMKEEKKK